MFNLVNKRWIFILISLVIIVPGTVSLILKGLNVGIDFAGGANVSLHPSQKITNTQEIRDTLSAQHLEDLQVVSGNNPQLVGNKTVWIRFNTALDDSVTSTVEANLKKKFGNGISARFASLNYKNKEVTQATITGFTAAPQASDVQAQLQNLPKTTDPNAPTTVGSTTPKTTPTAGATPKTTVTAQATANATAQTTPSATATPKAGATPTTNPTATSGSTTTNQGTIAVKADEVIQGNTDQTINLLTRSTVKQAELEKIQSALVNQHNIYTDLNSNATVEGTVAGETVRNSIFAVIAASVAILLYVWFAFRKIARPWRYGACAIIALLHDVLVVLGIFSILGWTLQVQIDALFITALLTVVGFSVHDPIVVFARIRVNMARHTTESFDEVVNASLVQTLSRSLNTSLTVILTLSALTLFGSEGSVRNFTLTLLIGIVSGTYSSIFNASMLLVMWEHGELGQKWFSRGRRSQNEESTRERARELARAK